MHGGVCLFGTKIRPFSKNDPSKQLTFPKFSKPFPKD